MKAVVKKISGGAVPVAITTEFIKLEAALKLANAVSSGGEAKNLIQDSQVAVGGEICTMRGKKLYPGDQFTLMGRTYRICSHESE